MRFDSISTRVPPNGQFHRFPRMNCPGAMRPAWNASASPAIHVAEGMPDHGRPGT